MIALEKKYHILVADDEPSVREVLRDLILALGNEYVVYSAADSFEALHMLQSLPLDLALIDIFMPGLDGFGLLKEARAKYPQVILVVITGQPSYKMVLEALRLGAADFLAKPISLAELRKILTKLKEKKAPSGKQQAGGIQKLGTDLETLTQEMHGKIQWQHFLHTLSEKLGAIRNAKALYPLLTELASTLSGGKQAAFFLYNQELGRLQLVSEAKQDLGTPAESGAVPQPALDSRDLLQPGDGRSPRNSLPPNCLSLPLKLRGELLGVLHIYSRPDQRFEPEVITRLELLVDRALLTLENINLHESINSNLYDTLTALINSLEARDPYSRHHSVRVTYIACHFAEKLNLASELVDSLRLAGALHDIGKIGIPDAILLKPDKLTSQEAAIIRQHSVIGDNIVAPLNLLPRERALILHHHERWDGKGYPLGLAGEDIPVLARIIALADSYDAITSDRPYRKRRGHTEALAEIAAHAGTQFDPELTRMFVEILSQESAPREPDYLSEKMGLTPPILSDQQLLLLKKSLYKKLMPLNGFKKTSPEFPQPASSRSDL